jgi:Tfp pilus assembly protein PilX
MRPSSLRRARERGNTLVLALVSLALVASYATTMLKAVDNERVGVKLQIDRTQAVKVSEGMLQLAESSFLDRVSNYQALQTPSSNNDFVVHDGPYATGGVDGTWAVARAVSTATGSEVMVGSSVVTDAAGLNTLVTPYVISATVQSGGAQVVARRYIELRQTPIFQFLSFFANDLEVLPGADMTLAGRIHTNQNMYVGAGSSLTIDTKYVRAAGAMHRHRKDDNSVQAGWVKIKHAVTNALVTLQSQANLASVGVGSSYGLDSSFTGWEINGDNLFNSPGEMPPFPIQAATQFGGTVGTGEMGVSQLASPSVASLNAFEPTTGGDYVESTPGVFTPVVPGAGTHTKGYYHRSATLIVKNNQAYDSLGVNITLLLPIGTLATKTMWDAREGKTVTLTQINLNKLKDMDGNPLTPDPSPFFPSNGLLYAYRTDTTATSGSGIVLSGGSAINAALTVVSPAPVYIHGDFNTVAKKAAAVMTDACHLLSSAWNWTNSSGSGLKIANNTTYNVAVMSGNTNTTAGNYNGGFENFPRFHENWTGKNATIKGSFVCTWNSVIHNHGWVYGSPYYTAPNRLWSYESNFDSPTGLPPYTPMANTTRSIAFEISQ